MKQRHRRKVGLWNSRSKNVSDGDRAGQNRGLWHRLSREVGGVNPRLMLWPPKSKIARLLICTGGPHIMNLPDCESILGVERRMLLS